MRHESVVAVILFAGSCVSAPEPEVGTPEVLTWPHSLGEQEVLDLLEDPAAEQGPSDTSTVDEARARAARRSAQLVAAASAPPSHAPDRYAVEFDTTGGSFTVEVVESAAPLAADRLHDLVTAGYFDGVPLYRVLEGRFLQFGLHSDPAVNRAWQAAPLVDEPRLVSNRLGTIALVGGVGGRTTQVLVNLTDNLDLDGAGVVPFGYVVYGMKELLELEDRYGDGPPAGRGPDQREIFRRGSAYLMAAFPDLDVILEARVVATN
ncbi:MAG: peptidylprolyl isomerase [Planctomycetota bacterium]